MSAIERWRAIRAADPKLAEQAATLFVVGGLAPLSLIVFSTGWAQLVQGAPKGPAMMAQAHRFASYYQFVYLAAIVAAGALVVSIAKRAPDIGRTVAVGALAGALATFALDGLRLVGVVQGWLPMDTPVLFGTVLLGPGSDPATTYLVGSLYHIVNGASIGLLYALVWGYQESLAAALKAGIGLLLLVELGMMTLPPMMPIVGLFGTGHAWPDLFLITLAAHIAFGAIMVLIVQATARPARPSAEKASPT